MRAISVKVNEVIGVAGFVVPGHARRCGGHDAASRTTACRASSSSNVQVLTAGTSSTRSRRKDGRPVPSTVVTLLVTPTDAERIALASTEGSIMLTLRNPLDAAPTETRRARAWRR